jgi:hypothetical protein
MLQMADRPLQPLSARPKPPGSRAVIAEGMAGILPSRRELLNPRPTRPSVGCKCSPGWSKARKVSDPRLRCAWAVQFPAELARLHAIFAPLEQELAAAGSNF